MVKIDNQFRQRLRDRLESDYEDSIDTDAAVYHVNAKSRICTVESDYGDATTVAFDDQQFDEIIQARRAHHKGQDSGWLRITAKGEFDNNGTLRRVIAVDSLSYENTLWKFDPTVPAIEGILAEIVADVPPEEFTRIPMDLCDKLDYYLYGAERNSKE